MIEEKQAYCHSKSRGYYHIKNALSINHKNKYCVARSYDVKEIKQNRRTVSDIYSTKPGALTIKAMISGKILLGSWIESLLE